MIITIFGIKGGSGKSTTSVNLGADILGVGKVAMIDLDPQRTTANWVDVRNEDTTLASIACATTADDPRDVLVDMNTRYDYVICDTAGRDATGSRAALLVSDIVVVPLKPSQPDMDTLEHVRGVCMEAQQINPKLKVLIVLTMVSTNARSRDTLDAREYIAEFPGINVAEATIAERKIYRDCMATGVGVVEVSGLFNRARPEIIALTKEVLSYGA